MQTLNFKPYSVVENAEYRNATTLTIEVGQFENVTFQEGKDTYRFNQCRFSKLDIENSTELTINNIHIHFEYCYIGQLNIENFISNNCSISFTSTILQGRIKNDHISYFAFNNCLLNNSLFLSDLKKLTISYTDENVYPIRWQNLFKSIKSSFEEVSKSKFSFNLYDCKETIFQVKEDLNIKSGVRRNLYSRSSDNNLNYYLTDKEKRLINISLSINYSEGKEHQLIRIVNVKLSALSISGYSTGALVVENSMINCLYLRNFSVKTGANFYNIKRYSLNIEDTKFELHKSNLDKVWFDNVSFDDYEIICFYRNRFGQVQFSSCNFPSSYDEFKKICTVENIHYPNIQDKNYYKIRYETFIQLKKQLELSGNFYEALKFQAISSEALKNIDDLPFADKLILRINNLSNRHGLSIQIPFYAIIIISIIFYLLYLLSLGLIFNGNEIDWNLFGYYFSFLDITHRTDFLVNKEDLNGITLALDYCSKVIIGFFLYQFIAAFRRYGKK